MPNTLYEEETTRFTRKLSEQIAEELRLNTDPEDQILREIAGEADRLDDLIDSKYLKSSQKVTASARRALILGQLHDLVRLRRENEAKESVVQAIANLVRLLQIVLDEVNTPKELKQTIVNNLLAKLEAEDKAKTQRGRVA
jgi:hypothetical protein